MEIKSTLNLLHDSKAVSEIWFGKKLFFFKKNEIFFQLKRSRFAVVNEK